MSALVCRDPNVERLKDLLVRLRKALGRGPSDRLNWKNIKHPEQRLLVAEMIGQTSFVKTTSVIVCKQHLFPRMVHTHAAYLFTLRFLLERLSWLAREHNGVASYTISHVRHFRRQSLQTYEFNLRARGTDTKIAWAHLDPYGGRLSNDRTVEALQLADLVASATARAFNATGAGPPDQTYLLALLPRAYRGIAGRENVLTSYGLKMHPWGSDVKPHYPWLLQLT
jgi:hypothetical protein